MEVLRNGKFTLILNRRDLAKGLRMNKNNVRDNHAMVNMTRMVGKNGVLSTLNEITRLATTAITDSFPYPQIFVFTNVIIICGETKIYEWVNSALVEKLEVSAGSSWKALDFFDYIYLTNAKVSVERDAGTKAYSLSSQPIASAACNYNGQVLLGAPGVSV